MPAIFRFLGYDPYPAEPSQPLSARLKACRRQLGLSQERLAGLLKVDESTIAHWEQGRNRPSRRLLQAIDAFLASQP